MSLSSLDFKVYKKELNNGLTVLVKPVHYITRVEAHLWYNVGSKDEGPRERGMAHLIEHMLFKGTHLLSESDINMVCQKLAGDANAFTSQDYTCYTFRFPSHVWTVALQIFAECMQFATFDQQKLASELKAVIEELRMYKDDFQGCLLEQMLVTLFPDHPYRNPIIGSKFDLCALDRDTLFAFYKKHYHPANAVLVVVGDVTAQEAFDEAERYLGGIVSPSGYEKDTHYFNDDIMQHATVLYRPVSSPWYCYAYQIPGFNERLNHFIDVTNLIVAAGKSSRLYRRLVEKDRLAVDVDCSVYDFFERGVLNIGVWPSPGTKPEAIERALNQELKLLATRPVLDWEFDSAQKRTLVDFTSLLESMEKQAFVIGNSYMATRDIHFIENYLHAIQHLNRHDLQTFFQQHFSPLQQHKGHLLPLPKEAASRLVALKVQAEGIEQQILKRHVRTTPVEPGRWVHQVSTRQPAKFNYPKPSTLQLANGMDVVYQHDATVPQVVILLSFKANYLYESDNEAGGFDFLLRVLTDATKKYRAQHLAQLLETEGIQLSAGGDGIAIRCLSKDFERALDILAQVVMNPVFALQSIEKIRQQQLSQLDEFWDSPVDFIDLIAKELVYQHHPYHKNPFGTKKTVKAIDKKVLQRMYHQYISPYGATMVIVGDLSGINLEQSVQKYFGSWKGAQIQTLAYPPLEAWQPSLVSVPMDREQVVIGFVCPSVARTDPNYNALALLDVIVAGGTQAGSSSRLFQLREQSGLFYTIGGSLLYGSRDQRGMMFIKTVVSADKVELAQESILATLDRVGSQGITQEELQLAKNLLFAAAIELFESNIQRAQTFLFLKKLNLNFNLFDKQGEILSIIKAVSVNEIAKRYCDRRNMSIIRIGRVESGSKYKSKKENSRKETHDGKEKSCKEKGCKEKDGKKKSSKKKSS